MKNIIKTAGYSLVAVSSVAYTSVNAAIDYGSTEWKVDSKLTGRLRGLNLRDYTNYDYLIFYDF